MCQTDVIPILALARALMPMRIRTGARADAGTHRGLGKNISSRDRVAELSTAIANQIRSAHPLSN